MTILRYNSVSSLATRLMVLRLRLSDKTVRKMLQSYLYTISDKNVAKGTQFLAVGPYKVYGDIRGGSLERGRQMRVWSLKIAIFDSSVHCLLNILHTWPHDSFQML